MKKSGMAGDEEDELEQQMAQMGEEELEQFMDDYLKLDFQGVVGDIKVSFFVLFLVYRVTCLLLCRLGSSTRA